MPFVSLKGVKFYYRIIGNGSKVLLAFHGYGQDSSYFNVMSGALGSDYTIYSFDLFYHGQSKLAKNLAPLNKQFLAAIIFRFLENQNISRFSLMGFSMGGKFVLSILEAFPEKIDAIFLIAPDGIGTSFWYNIATYPGFFQRLFKYSVTKPDNFFRFLDFMHSTRIVDQGLLRFAGWQMDSVAKRLRVYRSWMGFRKLTFDVRKISKLINQYKINFRLFIGQHDRVIDGRRLQVFARSLQQSEVVIVKSGHSFLLHEVAAFLLKNKK